MTVEIFYGDGRVPLLTCTALHINLSGMYSSDQRASYAARGPQQKLLAMLGCWQ